MSYLEHFELNEQPFRLTPDPSFVYWSKQHARAKAYMESTIWLADGFVVITGEIGSGKTTLLQSFLSELEEDVVYAVVSQTQLTSTQFLQATLTEFGFKPFDKHKVELLDMLNMFLIEQYSNGKKVVLIVDEAQNLSPKVLEEIRLLSGIETHKEKVLRIILAGQPELRDTLDSLQMKQLMQRVRLRFHIGPLDKNDTVAYIDHRVAVAGGDPDALFARESIDVIFRYSGGVPRLINTLCDSALLCAYADQKTTVDAEDVMSAVSELGWHEVENLRPATEDRTRAARRRRQRYSHRGTEQRRDGIRSFVPEGPHHCREISGQRDLHQEQVRKPPSPSAGQRWRALYRRGPQQHQRRVHR
jgi:type II secretory pathway predicted ATPase ExeA